MILVGLEWERQARWCESNACLADKLGLGGLSAWADAASAASNSSKGWVATRTCPWTTQAVPHVRPSSLDARCPKPAHLGTTNQPTNQTTTSLEVVFSCIPPRDSLQVDIAALPCLTYPPKLHRPPVALHLGTLTPDDPTLSPTQPTSPPILLPDPLHRSFF